MRSRNDKTRCAILKVLKDAGRPLGAEQIAQALLPLGLDVRPRTVRFHLLQLDDDGLTKLVTRRRGREITTRGTEELAHANVFDKVGLIAARIDTLGYRMSFDRDRGEGTVILNLSTIGEEHLGRALVEMQAVFAAGLTMTPKLAVARAGETLGGAVIPEGSVGLGTVCSITLNGILCHEGIPVTSRFGGLLELRDYRPVRFVELIEYRGSTLDPFEVFIRANMTDVRAVVREGTGVICASFREIPSVAVDDIHRIAKEMRAHGLGGILAVGRPNQPLVDIPVAEGRSGLIVVGGLNPVAALQEAGIPVAIRSLAALEEFSSFKPLAELRRFAREPLPSS